MRKLNHNHHRMIITVVIFLTVVFSLFFGTKIYDVFQNSNTINLFIFSMGFLNSVLLIIVLAFLIKLDEDMHRHHTKK